MPSPGQSSLFTVFTELVSTTYRKHSSEVADNVTKHNALFRRLSEKGNITREDGGLSIVKPLEYAENSTYQRYSGYDPLNIQPSDVISAAEFPWRQVATHVSASGLELRTNSGESRIINLVKSRIKNAMNSMKNGMSVDIYSDGTAANQINGLQALVADAGTGTVGGINSSTYTFWKNTVQSAASPLQGGSITPSKDTIESLMLPAWIRATRGADTPDLIVADETYFTYFEQSQTSLKRYAPSDDGQAGMISMKYKTADVFFDGNGIIPSAHMYMLNTDYMGLVVHRDADFEMMDEQKSINQDAVVIPILWMGNMTVSNRALQVVIKA